MTNSDISLEDAVLEFVEDAVGTYLDRKLDNLRKGRENNREHVLLDRLFPVERRIRSIIGGLETSLGTRFWEKLARYVAKSNDFELKSPEDFLKPTHIPDEINMLIQKWRAQRLIPNSQLGTQEYVSELKTLSSNLDISAMEFSSISGGDGIDLWLAKDGQEYIFDVKTVQINAGNGNSFTQKVMEWYAYRLLANPSVDLKVAMAFPYSPHRPFTVNSWWRVEGHKAFPLIRGDDALVQEEFWDVLGGQSQTWHRILAIFESLRNSEFAEKYHELFYPDDL